MNSDKRKTSKGMTSKIIVVSKNKPSKEMGEQKIKELSDFLSLTWRAKIGSK